MSLYPLTAITAQLFLDSARSRFLDGPTGDKKPTLQRYRELSDSPKIQFQISNTYSLGTSLVHVHYIQKECVRLSSCLIPGPHEFDSRDGRKTGFSGSQLTEKTVKRNIQDYLAVSLRGCQIELRAAEYYPEGNEPEYQSDQDEMSQPIQTDRVTDYQQILQLVVGAPRRWFMLDMLTRKWKELVFMIQFIDSVLVLLQCSEAVFIPQDEQLSDLYTFIWKIEDSRENYQ
jgi:hypothetical protein